GPRVLPEGPLERLVEALHLAAGLGVAVAGVLVLDAQARQLGLQVDLAAAGAGVEDQAVVAEPGSGVTVFSTGSVEDFDDVPGGDREKGDRGQEEAGVVVDEVEDLDLGAVGEAPVGAVALPHLGRDPGGLGPLLGLGRYQPAALQDAPDGG